NTVGAENDSTSNTLDALFNWWGNAAGPGPVDGAGRNPVIGKVDFAPYALSASLSSFFTGAYAGSVYVAGTTGVDNLTVTIGTGAMPSVKVQFGLSVVGTFTLGPNVSSDRVVIYGFEGADIIRVVTTSTTVPRNAEVHGGDGADRITGGAGNDVLWGDA